MKRWGIDSLVMRIWIHFVAILVVILMVLSAVYYLVIDRYEERVKEDEIKAGHALILDRLSHPEEKGPIDEGHLRRIDHFLVARTENGGLRFFYKGPGGGRGGQPDVLDGHHEIRSWMAGFAKDTPMKEQLFKAHKGGSEYVFMISTVDLSYQLPAIQNSGEFESDDSQKETENDFEEQREEDGQTEERAERYYLISYADPESDLSLVYIGLAIGAAVLLIGLAASKLAADNIAAPLREIEAYTAKISKKSWTGPLIIRRQDELGRLAQAMNAMQAELRRSEEEERQFLQSISHDLKTPVMVIMSHAQALIDGVHVVSAEETARVIRDEARHLEQKIRRILFLNTLDYAFEHNWERERFDWEDLLRSVAARMSPIRSDVTWRLETQPFEWEGDYEKLSVAVENIVDNGLRYAKGEIALIMSVRDQHIIIEIYNEGETIPDEKVERIFERLYKDKSGNFGLGLTITRKIIEGHKGHLEVINRPSGVSFMIKLPRSASS